MFENILGNEKNKKELKKMLELNKISHSYIFWGIEGIGKKLVAYEFAKEILGSNTDVNPDLTIIEEEDGKIKIDRIREMQKTVLEKPIKSSKKVYIIDDADKMTKEAQNCLLKTLEEPPEYATIILICSNVDGVLGTIKSRCTRIHFDSLDAEDVINYLKKKYPQVEISEKIITLSQGSIGKAEILFEKQSVYENLEKILKKAKDRDLIDIVQMAEEIYKSKEEINSILEYMNVLALKLSKEDIKYIKCIEIIEDTKKRLRANSNYDMCIDNMIFNIWEEVNEKNNRS
ncbi:MAG: AAA family ATPase [Clostridia bacterium]|nr:AAA family ATPase [Clostridia bacterium]